jgi:hypothetical protein
VHSIPKSTQHAVPLQMRCCPNPSVQHCASLVQAWVKSLQPHTFVLQFPVQHWVPELHEAG